jgi:hypothetical protein
MLNVFATDEELGQLKKAGYKIGATIEDSNTGSIRMAQRQATLDAEALAQQVAENGSQGRSSTASRSSRRRATRSSSAPNTFTDVVGPRRHHDGALPLRRGVQQVDQDHRHLDGLRTALALSLRGRRRRLRHGGQHEPLRRHRPDA